MAVAASCPESVIASRFRLTADAKLRTMITGAVDASVSGYSVLLAVLPASVVLLGTLAVPWLTNAFTRRREQATERRAAVIAFAAVARTTRTVVTRGWYPPGQPNDADYASMEPNRFQTIKALHDAEARVAAAMPHTLVRSITEGLVDVVTGEKPMDLTSLDSDLRRLLDQAQ